MFLNDRRSRLLFLATAPVIAATSLYAQSNYGAVRGIVTDPTGSAVGKAEVTLTSDSTKLSRTTTSNGSGEYVFNAVEPGKYTVSITVTGFLTEKRNDLTVDSGNTIPLDLTLHVRLRVRQHRSFRPGSRRQQRHLLQRPAHRRPEASKPPQPRPQSLPLLQAR